MNTKKDSTRQTTASVHERETRDADYMREAQIIRDILLSDKVGVNLKDFFRFYLSGLVVETNIVSMDTCLHDMPHVDPELLPVLYPEMRRRDGGCSGVGILIQSVLNGLAGGDDNAEEDAVSEILRRYEAEAQREV